MNDEVDINDWVRDCEFAGKKLVLYVPHESLENVIEEYRKLDKNFSLSIYARNSLTESGVIALAVEHPAYNAYHIYLLSPWALKPVPDFLRGPKRPAPDLLLNLISKEYNF